MGGSHALCEVYVRTSLRAPAADRGAVAIPVEHHGMTTRRCTAKPVLGGMGSESAVEFVRLTCRWRVQVLRPRSAAASWQPASVRAGNGANSVCVLALRSDAVESARAQQHASRRPFRASASASATFGALSARDANSGDTRRAPSVPHVLSPPRRAAHFRS